MEFLALVKNRFSVRSYKPDDVEEEKLNVILEAASLAPTAVNYQPFQLIVIKTKGHEDKLKRIYPAKWFTEAPLVICLCVIPSKAWNRKDGKNYADVDGSIVMDHIILAATSLGLGTCWVGAFDPDATREILDLPENVEPLVFTPLGYSAEEPRVKQRKKLSEIVKFMDL
jgi:nitroreductase